MVFASFSGIIQRTILYRSVKFKKNLFVGSVSNFMGNLKLFGGPSLPGGMQI